jgi:hypothetical protein
VCVWFFVVLNFLLFSFLFVVVLLALSLSLSLPSLSLSSLVFSSLSFLLDVHTRPDADFSFLSLPSFLLQHTHSDLRLDRLCATVVMLMEALAGLEHKYTYEIVGHSGETHHLPFVEFGSPPRNSRERLHVVQGMVEHAAECSSGDNTLAAGSRAVRDIRMEEADDYFVFLISDANLEGCV